ncbi:hypothetical protein TWF506_006622 [Arthrobotrys conoides]|uniref:Uncharacterized protein n=1 Tax=Arthrobotrys conoides TaxID=74498 RepID=A0AAN8N9P3_9PEZI
MGWWSWGEVLSLPDGTDRFPWVPEGGMAWRIARNLRRRMRYGSYVVVPNAIRVGYFEMVPGTGFELNEEKWVSENPELGNPASPGILHEYTLPEFDNGLIAVPKYRHEIGMIDGTAREKRGKAEANLRAREAVRIVSTGALIGAKKKANPGKLVDVAGTNKSACPEPPVNANANANAGASAGANPQIGTTNLLASGENGNRGDTDQIVFPPSSDALIDPQPSFIASLYQFGAAALLQQAQIVRHQLNYELRQLSYEQMLELQNDPASSLPPDQLVDILHLTRLKREMIDAGLDHETAKAVMKQKLSDLHRDRSRPMGGNMDLTDSGYAYTYGFGSERIAPDQLGPEEIQRMQEYEEALQTEEEGKALKKEEGVKEEQVVKKEEEGQIKTE